MRQLDVVVENLQLENDQQLQMTPLTKNQKNKKTKMAGYAPAGTERPEMWWFLSQVTISRDNWTITLCNEQQQQPFHDISVRSVVPKQRNCFQYITLKQHIYTAGPAC